MLGLLRVQPGEGGRVAAFAGTMALLQAGVALGMANGDALFLSRVGVAYLPWVYLATPALMLAFVTLYAALLGRVGPAALLEGTLGALVVGGLVLAWLVGGGDAPTPVYWAVKLYAVLWFIGLYSVFWNFADAYFDLQDGKRLFALFAAGGAAGAVGGGALVTWLTRDGDMARPYLAWTVLALLSWPLVRGVRRRVEPVEDAELPEEAGGGAAGLAGSLADMRASPFVRRLVAMLVLGLVVGTVVEFQTLQVLSVGEDEATLAGRLGGLFALVNVLNLLVNGFVYNRLVTGLGVGALTLWQPVAYLVAFAGLLFWGGMPAAVVGFFAYHGVQASIDYNNQNFLFAAIPSERRRQIRTVVEGMAEPLATALGGVALLLLAGRVTPQRLSVVGAGGAALYLVAALAVRGRYGPALASALRRGWLDLSRPAAEGAAALSADDLDALERAGREAPEPRVAGSALRVLALRDPGRAAEGAARRLEAVDPAASQAPNPGRGGAAPSAARPADVLARLDGADEAGRFEALGALEALADPACVAPLLLRADDFSPPLRRRCVRLVESLGLRSVPAAVAFLRDVRAPYTGRSIAARALGRTAPEQLAHVSREILGRELGRARRVRRFREGLLTRPGAGVGFRVLERFYADAERGIVDFVLEVLSVGGRLPDFELLAASLRATGTRERANALETLEQGVSRDVFLRLRPLLDPPRPGEGDPAAAAAASLGSFVAVECAAAARALWALDPGHAAALVKARLAGDEPVPLELADTVRHRVRGGEPEGGGFVERMATLAGAEYLEGVALWEMSTLARDSRLVPFAAGAPLPVDRPWIIAEGSARGAGGGALAPGDLGGGTGVTDTPERARAGRAGATLLLLPPTAVADLAARSPGAALTLLQRWARRRVPA